MTPISMVMLGEIDSAVRSHVIITVKVAVSVYEPNVLVNVVT